MQANLLTCQLSTRFWYGEIWGYVPFWQIRLTHIICVVSLNRWAWSNQTRCIWSHCGEYTFDGTMNKPKITFGKIQLNIKKDEPVSTSPPEDAEPISGKHCYSNICIFVVLTFFTYEMNALIRMNLQQVLEHLERIKIHWIMLLKSLLTIWKANVLKILWASRSSGAKPKHSILPYDSPFIGEIFFRL